MTARRPPRISDYSNEIQLGDSDSQPENDHPMRSNLSSPLTSSPMKVLSPYSSTALHPLLTDFGPRSATQYFRETLEKLRVESLQKAKGKETATSPICNQLGRRIRRNPLKAHKTVLDDEDSEDEQNDTVTTGDDANIFTANFGPNRIRADTWSEDEDIRPSTLRRRRRRKTYQSTWGGDVHGKQSSQTASILSAGASDSSPLQPSDTPSFPHLRAASPQTRSSTTHAQASQSPDISATAPFAGGHVILRSIEDPIVTDAPTSRNIGCDRRILCLCGANGNHEDLSLNFPSRPLKQTTRPNRTKSWPGKARESPSRNKHMATALFESSTTAILPTEAPAVSRRQRLGRSQDFEEHANEKRLSSRASGEMDLSNDDSDASEAVSMSYMSASAGSRHRWPPAHSRYRSPAAAGTMTNAPCQSKVRQCQNITRSPRQSIAQALDGINDEIFASRLDSALTRLPARRAASTRFSDQSVLRTFSAHRDEENLLGANLLFEDSEDEDAEFHSLWRRPRLSRSILRSPSRRRVLRGFQSNATAAGDENVPGNPFTPRGVPSPPNWSHLAQKPPFKTSAPSTSFDYGALTPQQLPNDIFARCPPTRSYGGKRQKATPRSPEGTTIPQDNALRRANENNAAKAAMAAVIDDSPLQDHEPQHPQTTWHLSPPQPSPNDPPDCPLGQDGRGWPNNLPIDIFIMITRYLSHQDVCNLRLVNSTFESVLIPVLFRNIVTKFGKSMFDVNLGRWERKPPQGSIFEKYGMEIHKFGICFEVDLDGLQNAASKVIQNTQSSWWGKYTWPVPKYPRFQSLELLENLADHLPLLRGAFQGLTNVSELALCVDSGHGWLNGPDMSDFAVWNLRCSKGHKVFGRTFQAEDKWHQYGRNELFKWAQLNSINEALKSLRYSSHMEQLTPESQFLKSIAIRDFDSYAIQDDQPDSDPERHTGGTVPLSNPTAFNAQHQPMFQQIGVPTWAWQPPPPNLTHMNIVPNPVDVHLMNRVTHRGAHGNLGRHNVRNLAKKGEFVQPQWPIIYNGHNLAAEIGGHCTFVQSKLADPRTFPLQPGHLTEAQAQWLMETMWAQRAFLSAYTTAILTNKANFKQVHSLQIAKISSGLLPALEQRELWQALPNLRTLKVLVSPDWRTEYVPGDQAFQTNMFTSPIQASIKFADFLLRYVSLIEHLCTLTIGFVGGGEHATGLLARNQHVLPAPVTSDPRSWLTDHITTPNLDTMVVFNHIKNLTIENAWLSPFMLEGFMSKSKDTSLRQLTLDSVSLTGVNSQRPSTPMTTLEDGLKPEYTPAAWLQERLPTEHCWPAVIDRLTPGVTFSRLKYDAGLIDPLQIPPPEPTFRGNVEKLTFKSCGYVKISGVPQTEFNQNGLVMPNTSPRDHGLAARESLLREAASVMMREKDPQGHEWFGLGRLTQCIHPVEKRVLEEAWQMRFGWGDDVERFGAVEDGFFEGGTGRFSGVVTK